jgi:hypothetical protein
MNALFRERLFVELRMIPFKRVYPKWKKNTIIERVTQSKLLRHQMSMRNSLVNF